MSPGICRGPSPIESMKHIFVVLRPCGLLLVHCFHQPSCDFHEGKGPFLVNPRFFRAGNSAHAFEKLIGANYFQDILRELKSRTVQKDR